MRKAFTLIELLVVIAIIAILAAILFPVFAQAKAAAKATASLSNTKQNTLAIIMYAGDVDDTFVIAQANGTQPGQSFAIPGLAEQVTPWTSLIQPYSKNVDLFRDPLGPTIAALPPFNVSDTVKLTPEYGFNFAFLNTVTTTGFSGVSATTAANPADTVLITSKNAFSESTGFQKITPSTGWDASTSYLAFPPAGAGYGVTYNWGRGGFFETNVAAVEGGKYTGGVSPRSTDKVIVGFVDGHAKKLDPNVLAGGTGYNYDKTGASTTLTTNVIMPLPTDAGFSKFIWDLQ
jgi:prepilin-type N-terminal cleavage/methylation domain-containing protein